MKKTTKTNNKVYIFIMLAFGVLSLANLYAYKNPVFAMSAIFSFLLAHAFYRVYLKERRISRAE